ncbi:MFS transporter [SAR202 cluster bacterium AC-647-N09_OGT_505m]|nr:MFS transporter [SAR202 cluster bacterium AC-647-N09_OGT_505m]
MRKLGILAALRHRNFRIYWLGFVTSVSGMQMFLVVQAWLVFDLTGSALQLGLVALARALPSVILGLVGGVVADKVDQRRLLIATTAGVAAIYLALGTLTWIGVVQVWHILVSVFLVGGFQAFDQPSRQAIFPNLIDRLDMMSAVALNTTIHPGTRIFAPVVAGLLIDYLGVQRQGAALAIFIVAGTYATFSYMMFKVHLPPIERVHSSSGFQDLKNGISYILASPVFRLLIITSFINAFFGMSHVTLMPVFAHSLLGDASGSAISLLFTAAGIGGLMGAVIGGSLGAMRRKGWLIIGGASMYGGLLIAFAFAPWYGLALALEWLASICLQVFSVTSQSALHTLVPDEFRGRVMGIWGMTHSVMQPLGGMVAGGAASGVAASVVVAIGGGVVSLFGLFGVGRESRIRNIWAEGTATLPARSV